MTLWELITAVREQYVELYRQTIRHHGPTVQNLMAEPLVRAEVPDAVPVDYRVFRPDLVWTADDKPQVGGLAPMVPIVPQGLSITYPDGQQLSVIRFAWDDCAIIVSPPPTTDAPILAWLREWRDRVGVSPDGDGLLSAVHSMTPPRTDGTSVLLVVDFGSAAPEAFTSLIAALLAGGVKDIRITTAPPTQQPPEPPQGVVA